MNYLQRERKINNLAVILISLTQASRDHELVISERIALARAADTLQEAIKLMKELELEYKKV